MGRHSIYQYENYVGLQRMCISTAHIDDAEWQDAHRGAQTILGAVAERRDVLWSRLLPRIAYDPCALWCECFVPVQRRPANATNRHSA